MAGKCLDQRFLDNPQKPLDELFQWHFRPIVLINIRVAGEPVFEHGFPSDSDIMGNIITGLKATERMQFELFSREAIHFDLTESPRAAG
jgi:hypothetical protein